MTLGQSADFIKYFLSTLPEEPPEGADSEWIESDNQLREALGQAIRCMNNVDFALKDIEDFNVSAEWKNHGQAFQLGACAGLSVASGLLRKRLVDNSTTQEDVQ